MPRKQPSKHTPMTRGALIFFCVFLLPFFLVGGSFLVVGLKKVAQGQPAEGWPIAGFALVFLIFSAGFLSLIIFGYRKSRRQAAIMAEKEDAPWLWREDWAAGEARSARKVSVIAIWLFAIVWNGVSAPIFFVFQREWENGNKAILIGLLFPIIGIIFLIVAIRMTLQWRRFGNARLDLETLPGHLGHHFQARLIIPATVVNLQKVDLRLACIRRTTTGSGKNRSTHEKLLWEEKRVAPHDVIELTNEGTSLPVYFALPPDQPESLAGNPAIVWKLEAKADIPGVDFSETFEVPVFATRDTGAEGPGIDPLADYQETLDVGTAPVIKGIRIRETPVGVDMEFHPARNAGSIAGLVTFTAIWTGILVFMVQSDVPFFFAAVWGLFDLLMITGVISAIFHGIHLQVIDRALTIEHRLIIPMVKRNLPAGSVRQVTAVPGMKSGRTQFYKVMVEDQSGRRFHAGSGIREKRDATWIAERIAIAVGL